MKKAKLSQLDYDQFRKEALDQLRSGQPLDSNWDR